MDADGDGKASFEEFLHFWEVASVEALLDGAVAGGDEGGEDNRENQIL